MKKSRKEEIRDAAAQLFRKKGYQATSMRDIAEVVGIKAASIYNHIDSKKELLEDLCLRIAHLFTNGMKDINGSSLDAKNKMERLITLHIRLTVEHTDAIALLAGEWVHLEGAVRETYINLRDTYEKDFKIIIEEGKAKGLFKAIDTDIILFSVLSSLRWLYSWYSKNKHYNLVDLEHQMTECLLAGIKK